MTPFGSAQANTSGNDFKSLKLVVKLLSIALYSYAIVLLLRDYAIVQWSFYGFSYQEGDIYETMLIVAFVGAATIASPDQIRSPSTLILIVFFLLAVIPALLCIFLMESRYVGSPILFATAIVAGFAISCWLNRRQDDWTCAPSRTPHRLLVPVLVAALLILLAFLYWRFGQVMSFVALDDIYYQRERGAAQNLIEGYSQTYSQYVLSTGLIAIGLYYRRYALIGLGLLGSLTNYMITAEKAGLMYPVFIFGLYLAFRIGSSVVRSTSFLAALFAGVLIFAVRYFHLSSTAEFLAWYLGMRTILTPGSFIVHYQNFFESSGHTYFSHIRGLNFFIPVPEGYLNDARYPELGLIMGEDYFNFDNLNANASFLASDGIASLGLLGIPLILIAFGFALRAFDTAARDTGFVSVLILLPIALTLTNGSLFTVLASFGGLFWLAVFRFGFIPDRAPRRSRAENIELRPLRAAELTTPLP